MKTRLLAPGTLGPVLALIVACAFFASRSDRFLTGDNLSIVLQQVMVVGVIAIGQTLVILTAGVDPESMYSRIYGSVPLGRLHLLRDALDSLEVDMAHGMAWVKVHAGALERHGVSSEDLDGVVEHPRSVAGVRLAMLFRDLGHGKVKVSFRSLAGVNVNTLARAFGGGGHARASGALIAGTLAEVETRVLGEARHQLDTGALAD